MIEATVKFSLLGLPLFTSQTHDFCNHSFLLGNEINGVAIESLSSLHALHHEEVGISFASPGSTMFKSSITTM